MDWYLCDNGLRLERVNRVSVSVLTVFAVFSSSHHISYHTYCFFIGSLFSVLFFFLFFFYFFYLVSCLFSVDEVRTNLKFGNHAHDELVSKFYSIYGNLMKIW